MPSIIANIDPQIHSINGKLRKVLNQMDDAKIIEKECVTEEDVIDFATNADAILTARGPVTQKVINKLTKCKVIGRFGTGTDNVDHNAATEKGIVVVYVPNFCTEEVANHVLMFILACNKQLLYMDNTVRRGQWGQEPIPAIEAIAGQILGLIGFGRIAKSLTLRAQTLGMTVLSYDPFVEDNVFKEFDVEKSDLEKLLYKSDYVSLNVPLTKDTKNVIGFRQLQLMKQTAYLINCGRGELIDEQALFKALKKKAIAGAALDCLTREPPEKNNPLFELDNVILTPHSAAYSESAIAYLREKTVRQVIDVLSGLKPEFIRNPEVLKTVHLVS